MVCEPDMACGLFLYRLQANNSFHICKGLPKKKQEEQKGKEKQPQQQRLHVALKSLKYLLSSPLQKVVGEPQRVDGGGN